MRDDATHDVFEAAELPGEIWMVVGKRIFEIFVFSSKSYDTPGCLLAAVPIDGALCSCVSDLPTFGLKDARVDVPCRTERMELYGEIIFHVEPRVEIQTIGKVHDVVIVQGSEAAIEGLKFDSAEVQGTHNFGLFPKHWSPSRSRRR